MKIKISCEINEKNIQKQSPRGFLQNGNMVPCKYAVNLENTETRYSNL